MNKVLVIAPVIILLLVLGCTERIVYDKQSKFQVANPKFSPSGGVFNNKQHVTITCQTDGASIYYTVDGTDPTNYSNIYTEPIEIVKTQTLKAQGYKKDWNTSTIVSSAYKLVVTPPELDLPSGTYDNIQTVSISCKSEGAAIHYTTDGSEPTYLSSLYSDPIIVSKPTTLKVKGIIEGWEDSKTTSNTYDFKVSKPILTPPSGTYNKEQTVTITCETIDAAVYYTLDGSEPTKQSKLYTTPIAISNSLTLKAKAFQDGWKSSETALANYDIYDVMVFIAGGNFQMGSKSSYWDDERPVHSVTISSFYISKYELTQKEWVAVMNSNPSSNIEEAYPVENVSWYNAIDYCNKRSIREGFTPCYSINGNTNPSSWETGTIVCNWSADGYRLPTEAEWEYAARGGNQSNGYLYSGSNEIKEYFWYNGNSGYESHPVGLKRPNELGLYDMSGNVYEWCWDWYGVYPSSYQTNPYGPSHGATRVTRGGSYYNYANYCTVSARGNADPKEYYSYLGFRVCRNAP